MYTPETVQKAPDATNSRNTADGLFRQSRLFFYHFDHNLSLPGTVELAKI